MKVRRSDWNRSSGKFETTVNLWHGTLQFIKAAYLLHFNEPRPKARQTRYTPGT
jgi:hypothetical protein